MELSRAEARRLALAAQGLGARPEKPTAAHARRAVERLQGVHIDSINVLARSHRLVMWSRLGPHRPDVLEDLAYRRRRLYEGQTHSTAFLPLDLFPLLRHRMDAIARRGAVAPNGTRPDPRFVEAVHDELAERGPLTVEELSQGGAQRGPWWGWSAGKVALEHLWATGRAAIAGREGFTRVYDLAERVIPPEVLGAPAPPEHEAQRRLLARAAASVGVAPGVKLADRFGMRDRVGPRGPDGRWPKFTWPDRLREAVEEGLLAEVAVEGWREPGYVAAGGRPPRSAPSPATLLSPFDDLVRVSGPTLFDFEQHLAQQLYVPAERRLYGYYVLPFLLGDDLVARCDLKADRQAGTLLVVGAWLEPGRHGPTVAGPLAAELAALAAWLELDRVVVADRGDLAPALRRAAGRRSLKA